VRDRFRRWRIDKSAPQPMQAAITARGTLVHEAKTTVTRVAAGALIAGPASGVVGAMAKKRKRSEAPSTPPLIVWGSTSRADTSCVLVSGDRWGLARQPALGNVVAQEEQIRREIRPDERS
jgi:hypothetical protein